MQAKRWPIYLVIGGALLVVIALCALSVVGGFLFLQRSQASWNVFTDLDTPAQVEESRVIEVEVETDLEIFLDAGDIQLTSGEPGEMLFEMVKTAWRANQEEAEAAAAALQVGFTETAGKVSVKFSQPEGLNLDGRGLGRVDMTLHVPPATNLVLNTRFGSIEVSNIDGEIQLSGGFGDIAAEDLSGSLEISNQNGEIIIKRVDAPSGDVLVENSFGGIIVQNVTAQQLRLETDNGDLVLEDISAESALFFKTQFGKIELTGFEAASLEGASSNGGIDLQDGILTGDLVVESGFEAVSIQDVAAGSYQVTSRNGKITVTSASGRIDLRTDFGDLEVIGAQDAALDLYTGNGKIRFSGSLDESAVQSLETRFGDIEMLIPAGSSFDIHLETQFGSIQSELPVTLQGEFSEKSMSGEMNSGGTMMTIKTQNGNITLSESGIETQGE